MLIDCLVSDGEDGDGTVVEGSVEAIMGGDGCPKQLNQAEGRRCRYLIINFCRSSNEPSQSCPLLNALDLARSSPILSVLLAVRGSRMKSLSGERLEAK